MSRPSPRFGVLILACIISRTALAGDTPPKPPAREALDIRRTQATIVIQNADVPRPFRATVLAIKDDVLTVLTAARFVDALDEGHAARFVVGNEAIEGIVLSVVRNPSYRVEAASGPRIKTMALGQGYTGPRRTGHPSLPYYARHPVHRPESYALLHQEIPGADNAVARIWFPRRHSAGQKPVDLAFEALRPARSLVAGTFSTPNKFAVTARIIDANSREHIVRAGNFENPRLLEWGRAFRPKLEDSGAGVFFLREGTDGPPEPVLIGVLLARDAMGGTGSLVSLGLPWLADALRDSGPDSKTAETPPLNPSLPGPYDRGYMTATPGAMRSSP